MAGRITVSSSTNKRPLSTPQLVHVVNHQQALSGDYTPLVQ
jgi:hypothetical protein